MFRARCLHIVLTIATRFVCMSWSVFMWRYVLFICLIQVTGSSSKSCPISGHRLAIRPEERIMPHAASLFGAVRHAAYFKLYCTGPLHCFSRMQNAPAARPMASKHIHYLHCRSLPLRQMRLCPCLICQRDQSPLWGLATFLWSLLASGVAWAKKYT